MSSVCVIQTDQHVYHVLIHFMQELHYKKHEVAAKFVKLLINYKKKENILLRNAKRININ